MMGGATCLNTLHLKIVDTIAEVGRGTKSGARRGKPFGAFGHHLRTVENEQGGSGETMNRRIIKIAYVVAVCAILLAAAFVVARSA